MMGEKTRDTSWDTPYIHKPEHEIDDTSQVRNFDQVFTVYLGHRKNEFTPDRFLQACWTDGFDTPCAICRESFDLAIEPPVRLLSLEQHKDIVDPLTEHLPPLVVQNYHLRCLRAHEIKYVPVSHPWHPSIAEAYALRIFNAKGAQTCYEAPIRTLLAVARRFGPDISLWHDYISIPQWQDDFRGTVILPQIFKIFEASGCAILHLEHQPPIMQTPAVDSMINHSMDLERFFGAHLFSRLWPIVEFDRAGEAYVMSKDYSIMESKFSWFVAQILDVVNGGNTTMSYSEMSALKWMHDLPIFVRERQKNKCLGYVYDMIADLGCRSFRDKFIGASELLGISDYPTELPRETKDACLWLAERQIQRNDISPILLRPSTEPIFEKARWLKGHEHINKHMWGWGVQTQPTLASPQLHEHSVLLNLKLHGTIVNDFSWQQHTDNHSSYTSAQLLRLITDSGSTTEFLNGIQQVDLAPIFRLDHNHGMGLLPRIDHNVLSSKIFSDTLSSLLVESAALKDLAEPSKSLILYDKVVSLLALSASRPRPKLDHFGILSPNSLRHQICDPSECSLVSISCTSCHEQSIFRVEIWQKPMTDARLYLIPGLTYQYTATNGTGIIMEHDQIIGRARFCASACDCNESVTVKIG